jgi:Flp pilus assembly protein TadG
MRILDTARERGAAAVEMAVVLPLLLLMLGGIVDFGRAFYTEVSLTNAARDGVRLAAIQNADAVDRAERAAQPLDATAAAPATCTSGNDVTMTVTLKTPFQWTLLAAIPGLPTPSLEGKATMTCV